jgi:protein phosphatase PTC7
LKQGLDASHPLSKWRDSQLEKSPNGAGHDWFFVEGIPSSPNEAKQVESTTTSTSSTTEQGESEIEKVRIGGIKGVVLGVAGTHTFCPESPEMVLIRRIV